MSTCVAPRFFSRPLVGHGAASAGTSPQERARALEGEACGMARFPDAACPPRARTVKRRAASDYAASATAWLAEVRTATAVLAVVVLPLLRDWATRHATTSSHYTSNPRQPRLSDSASKQRENRTPRQHHLLYRRRSVECKLTGNRQHIVWSSMDQLEFDALLRSMHAFTKATKRG